MKKINTFQSTSRNIVLLVVWLLSNLVTSEKSFAFSVSGGGVAAGNAFTPCKEGECQAAPVCRSSLDAERRFLIERVLPYTNRVFVLNPELARFDPQSERVSAVVERAVANALRAAPPKHRRPAARLGRSGPADGLGREALDDVALADVLVVLEGHAAFVALLDLAHLVLEAAQGVDLVADPDTLLSFPAQDEHDGSWRTSWGRACAPGGESPTRRC